MKLRWNLISLLLLVVLAGILFVCLPHVPWLIPYYSQYIYLPFQSFRGMVIGPVPFSLGDVIYILLGLGLLITLIRWVKYLFNFSDSRVLLANSVIRTLKTILKFYLFFIIGWGANYYKPSLSEVWHLIPFHPGIPTTDAEKTERRKIAMAHLVAFDQYLVDHLNEYAPHYHPLSLLKINERAKEYYATYTDCKVKRYGLDIKPTMFGYFMERLGTEGYYNPFTGEGQIDTGLPGFTLPFLICHEMAHQTGIGSEEDANLLAYALCTATPDSSFRYSSYLNLWEYTNNRLYRRDSLLAHKFEAMLNPLTTAHLDTLEQLAQKYQNDYARMNTRIYDSYLKMNDQKEGMRSYGNVTSSAWLLEMKRKQDSTFKIQIP